MKVFGLAGNANQEKILNCESPLENSSADDDPNINLAVWQYVKKNEETGKILCNQCEKSICDKNETTSELVVLNHLKSAHNISATQKNIKQNGFDSEDVEKMRNLAKYILHIVG